MAALAASNFVPSFCETPYLRVPLIISESLRSAISSDGSSTQGIVSILLSGADLVKLDLSKLQLFSMDGFAAERATSRASLEQHSELNCVCTEDFTFQTPLILSPVEDLSPGSLAFPVFKSKGVVEAERANAENQSLKLGAVSPSPRARKKALSMDEISLTGDLSSLEDDVVKNVAGKGDSETHVARDRVRVRRELPKLELAPLPRPGSELWAPLPQPGLEQRAEALKKKHFERVLSRTLSEVRNEDAKIDLNASPAARFLLQVMPWELTPPITPITTPAAVPFVWEDVPGQPKPRALPSPCPSLPLPPRLVPVSSSLSSSTESYTVASSSSSDSTDFVNGDLVPSDAATAKPPHGRRHRKNMHSWHVLHFFRGSNQVDQVIVGKGSDNPSALRPEDLSSARGETCTDGASAMSTCINSSSTLSYLSPTVAIPSEEKLSSCETSLSARYELPPLYVAPVTPLTSPYEGLAPLDDDCSKQTNRLHHLAKWFRQEKAVSSGWSFFNHFKKHGKATSDGSSYLLNDDKEGKISSKASHCVHSSQLYPTSARSPIRGRRRNHLGFRSTNIFIKLRRRGARVIVASCRAIKRVLLRKRARHARCSNISQLPYHTLNR